MSQTNQPSMHEDAGIQSDLAHIEHDIKTDIGIISVSVKIFDNQVPILEDEIIEDEAIEFSDDDQFMINDLDGFLQEKWDKIKSRVNKLKEDPTTFEKAFSYLPEYIQDILNQGEELPEEIPSDIREALEEEYFYITYNMTNTEGFSDSDLDHLKNKLDSIEEGPNKKEEVTSLIDEMRSEVVKSVIWGLVKHSALMEKEMGRTKRECQQTEAECKGVVNKFHRDNEKYRERIDEYNNEGALSLLRRGLFKMITKKDNKDKIHKVK